MRWASLLAIPAVLARKPLEEPSQTQYFGLEEKVLPLERVRDISPEEFERRIMRGIPFIIEDAGRGNPFMNSNCEDFNKRFPQAEMRAEYTGDGPSKYVKLGNKMWVDTDRTVTASKHHLSAEEGGKVAAPYVWHVKDGGHEAPKEVKKAIQSEWQPAYFLNNSKINIREANESTEFWFSRRKGGVFAHADTYCIPAVSLQLKGQKKWRLMPAPPAQSLVDRYAETDGAIYSTGLWTPTWEATVNAGEAVMLFPNIYHETYVPEDNPECTVATTFQFQLPSPAIYIRNYFPTLATSHLYSEAHCPDLWHSFSTLAPPNAEKPTTDEKEAKKAAAKRFKQVDTDSDGQLSLAEIQAFLGSSGQTWARWFYTDDFFYEYKPTGEEKKVMGEELKNSRARQSHAYLDEDGDGNVSSAEFESAWWQWSLVHHRAKRTLPMFEEKGGIDASNRKKVLAAEAKYTAWGGKPNPKYQNAASAEL